jgi:hypothetical protein
MHGHTLALGISYRVKDKIIFILLGKWARKGYPLIPVDIMFV